MKAENPNSQTPSQAAHFTSVYVDAEKNPMKLALRIPPTKVSFD